jgi:spore coat protein U-like protein
MRIRGFHGRLRAAIVASALIAFGARAAPTCKGLSTAGSAGSFNPRGMVGADVLGDNLYADAARTVVWGDGTSASATVPGVTSTNPATANIYGRIFPLQSVGAGNYSDTLIVTINF